MNLRGFSINIFVNPPLPNLLFVLSPTFSAKLIMFYFNYMNLVALINSVV